MSTLTCPRCSFPFDNARFQSNKDNLSIKARYDAAETTKAMTALKQDLRLITERRAMLQAIKEQLDRDEAEMLHQLRVHRASAIQSIFSRLPVEILGLIFVFYLDDQPEDLPPRNSESWRPYTLSLVCSRWRDAIFRTFAELWSNIRVDVSYEESSWKPYLMQHLEYSRNRPLHISFTAPSACETNFIHAKVFGGLKQHADRIETLNFQIPPTLFNVHAVLSGMQSNFNSLKAITLPYAEHPRDDVLVCAPTLRSAVLEQVSSISMLWQLPWAQLTSLTLNRCEVEPIIFALSQAPHLSSLSLGLFPHLMFEGGPIPNPPVIHLKALRHLEVRTFKAHRYHGFVRPMQRTMQMFSNMRLPKLESIDLYLPFGRLARAISEAVSMSSASITRLSIHELWIADKTQIGGIATLMKTVSGTLRELNGRRDPFSEHRYGHQISLLRKADSQLISLFIPGASSNPDPFPHLDRLTLSLFDFNEDFSENLLRLVQSRRKGTIDIGFAQYSRKVQFQRRKWEVFVEKLQECLQDPTNAVQARVTLNV